MSKTQILFVGDFEKAFLKNLNNDAWEIKNKISSEEALTFLENEKVNLIVAKDKVERINGYQLCLLIKSVPHLSHLPFYILGEKKQRGSNVVGSIFAKPDRCAEYTEVMSKPQSLIKLLKEDLKNIDKNAKTEQKVYQFFPASTASELSSDLVTKINNELLLERLVLTRLQSLYHWPRNKNQYLDECFAALKDVIKADLFGIAIATAYKPWVAFKGSKSLNQGAFDSVLDKVSDNFILAQDVALMSSPPLVQNGGSTISDLIIAPIIGDKASSGTLILAQYDNQKFSPVDKVIIDYLRVLTKPVFEFLIAEQAMEKMQSREAVKAAVDPLTGVYNLDFLIGFLQQQLLFSFRNKLAVSLLMIDIDRFGQINNALGQAVADTVLAKLAEKLLSIIRGSDLLARYNSDKFVIVLPNTALKGARVLAEKIRLEIEHSNFFAGRQPGPSITVSIGVAEHDPHDLNPETILKEAKSALQKAKEGGRNKVSA